MSTIRETSLPGVGRKFQVETMSGDRLVTVIHDDGTRELYHFTRKNADRAVVIVNWTTWGRYQTPVLPDRFWAVGVFLLAPLMGMPSVLAAMRLSAKITEPQSANQFTGLVIVPTFMLGIGIFGKVLTISMAAVAIACLVVVLLTLFLLRLNLKNSA